MKVLEALAKALVDDGVDTLFGLIGDANLFMVNAYVLDHGGNYVGAAHEAGAVCMAAGYAAASGTVGVATVTHGPALTNTATALVEAVRDRTPLVVIAGETPASQPWNVQRVDQRALVASTGAGYAAATSPTDAVGTLRDAMWRAEVEQRPIVVGVPSDLMWDLAPDPPLLRRALRPTAIGPHADALDRAVGVLASARRPIVVAGHGAASARARRALLHLADRIGAPVATTLKGKDLFRGEPSDLGILGTVSSPRTVEVVLDSDCIVAFGASLNRYTLGAGAYATGKRIVQCVLHPGDVATDIHVDAPVLGDAATVAEEICRWLDTAEVPPTGFRSSLPATGDELPVPAGDSLDLPSALARIDRMLPADRVLVTDGGRFVYQAWMHMHAPDPRSFVPTTAFGSIGLGMGTAIGAWFTRKDRPVVLVTGDGGFLLGGLTEFVTAVRHEVDLIVVVCNDGSYGAEHTQLTSRGMDPAIACFDVPDLVAVARSLGGSGYRVEDPADLDGIADAVAGRDAPLLIDLRLDPAMVPSHPH